MILKSLKNDKYSINCKGRKQEKEIIIFSAWITKTKNFLVV